MVDPVQVVGGLVTAAIADAFELADVDPVVHGTKQAGFDLQSDVAGMLARRLRQPPQAIATRIADALRAHPVVARAEAAGMFVNIALADDWLADAAIRARADARLGVPLAANLERVVIDYSAPNVAKEMHVGHLRSTIIGDALARTLEWRGHTVIRQNHLGDWGTPLGMLYEHAAGELAPTVERMGELYREANVRFENDVEFAGRARARVVALQGGLDAGTRVWWQQFVDLSTRYHAMIYARLDVTLRPGDIRAESFYNDRLAPLVDELLASGRAVVSEGAVCMFPAGFTNRQGGPLPLMLRKTDGGYGYGITDLAAIRFRLTELGATRLLYVVGASQARHLAQVHTAATELGWLQPPSTTATHVPFGFVLGTDGRPLASREGTAPRLLELIDSAIARADKLIAEREDDRLPPELHAEVARDLGVGSIKYADLSCDRVKDYVFDIDRMVAFRGDTAGYLQYAHARACGILREAGDGGAIHIGTPEEHVLVVRLLELGSIVAAVDRTLEPHRLAGYLFDVATAFTAFYLACPVLTSSGDTRTSRIAITQLVRATLARGLDLLGIRAPDRM